MAKTFVIVVSDAMDVYTSLDDFATEVETMVRGYVFPADVVSVHEVTDSLITTLVAGVGRKVSPTGSPAPTSPYDGLRENLE
jgi:hypothetical protein